MIDDVVHNRNYETGHQLEKLSSVSLPEISAIRMALVTGAYSNMLSWSIFDFVGYFKLAYDNAVRKDYM
jgi:hypothetical protein